IHQPVAVAGGFHADQCGRRYLPVEPFRVARGLYQLLLPSLSRLRIQPAHLLPAGMKITSYNHHVRRLLSFREALVLKPRLPDSIEPSLLSNQPLCPNVNARLCVEEQLFRADVEERLFRAALACAFDCGLQPRPALKGIHHPAVAAMNGRSSTLTQALVLRARRNRPEERNAGTAQVRGPPPLCPNVNARLYVEEQLFRADVEERLFRAASACAFDCGLQPRPALKGIHHPAVAAMNGRSSTLTQALVLRARRNIQTEGNPGAAQVRGTHPCVSNTW